MIYRYDYLVIGSGIAGMSFALKASSHGRRVAVICKSTLEDANTYFAQGGVASVTNLLVDDFDKHIHDTMVAGDWLSDPAAVEQVVKNAKVLSEELTKQGFRLVSGGTDNHLCLLDLRPFHITGKEFENRLDAVQITANKNAIPNDPEKPFVTSGVRVGTPAVTSRGFKEPEMIEIARWMGMVARDFEGCRYQVRSEVDALCRRFPIYE